MFHRLFGVFVSGLVIFLTVMRRGYAVRVRGKLVVLSGSLVRIVCHEILRSAHTTVALCGGDVHDVRGYVERAIAEDSPMRGREGRGAGAMTR